MPIDASSSAESIQLHDKTTMRILLQAATREIAWWNTPLAFEVLQETVSQQMMDPFQYDKNLTIAFFSLWKLAVHVPRRPDV